jgi:hypothetical protein
MTYKVHIDGFNLLPYLTGEVDKSPRPGLIYFSDDGDVLGIRWSSSLTSRFTGSASWRRMTQPYGRSSPTRPRTRVTCIGSAQLW